MLNNNERPESEDIFTKCQKIMKKQTCENCKWFKEEGLEKWIDNLNTDDKISFHSLKLIKVDCCQRLPKWEQVDKFHFCGEFKGNIYENPELLKVA